MSMMISSWIYSVSDRRILATWLMSWRTRSSTCLHSLFSGASVPPLAGFGVSAVIAPLQTEGRLIFWRYAHELLANIITRPKSSRVIVRQLHHLLHAGSFSGD